MAFVGLLDTNILSAIMRDADGTLRRRVRAVGADAFCTSVIVASELRFGAERTQSLRLKREVEEILTAITVVPFEPPAAIQYARVRVALERQGTPIGANDLFIAAHALALDLVLVTANTGEFERVPRLRVENWLD